MGAKNYEALQYLNKIIRDRDIDKLYLTLVVGQAPKHFVIEKAIEKQFNEKFSRAQMMISEKN